MRRNLLAILFLAVGITAFGQENNERYENAAFRISQGFSTGASVTDVVVAMGSLSAEMKETLTNTYFEKDIIFDVAILEKGGTQVVRVSHLNEVTPQDIKLIFIETTGLTQLTIAPSRDLKLDALAE